MMQSQSADCLHNDARQLNDNRELKNTDKCDDKEKR